MNAHKKASLDLKRPMIMANSSNTEKEQLHSGTSESNSHLGIGNAVPSCLRGIKRYIRTNIPDFKAATLKYLDRKSVV